MKSQNYDNHSRFVTGFHFILSTLLFAGLIVSIINLCRHWQQNGKAVTLMLVLVFVCLLFIFWFMRQFALKAQDRAIRAEESLRYFILTGKAIDSRITIGQIIALRFAPDEEIVLLTEKAAAEGLLPNDIKKEIKNWRADNHRA
ncbi:hypothetical protein BDD43_3186 [Mucilaginibacter gracilis]|uniref:Uncharacterized protein n=1 Tax=Mucilaginibacter gracilis TaxID=423350 RepID=A0A495J1Y2_9SPHI|nr:DUF6526 family protein [Mucilaginibacter gracilis]RKR82986.1 hypothetical protein BDD43_3186 [Mucilaginibacter gracilis]